MCDTKNITKLNCKNLEFGNGSGKYIFKGKIPVNNKLNSEIIYYAANPPDRRHSFSGSGLPFPNSCVAFENTKNVGMVKSLNGNFTINLHYPNSFYRALGTIYVPPTLFVKECLSKKIFSFILGNGIPYRTLTYPVPRQNATFYDNRDLLPIRNQENILRNYSFPRKYQNKPLKYWGLKPPHN